MIKFNTLTLTESHTVKDNKTTAMENTQSEPSSYIHALLEYNSRMHEIDVAEKIRYYRILKESSAETKDPTLSKALSDSIKITCYDAIQAMLDNIKDYRYHCLCSTNEQRRILADFNAALKKSRALLSDETKYELQEFCFFNHRDWILKSPAFFEVIDRQVNILRDIIDHNCYNEDCYEKLKNVFESITGVPSDKFGGLIRKKIDQKEIVKCAFYKFNGYYASQDILNQEDYAIIMRNITQSLEKLQIYIMNKEFTNVLMFKDTDDPIEIPVGALDDTHTASDSSTTTADTSNSLREIVLKSLSEIANSVKSWLHYESAMTFADVKSAEYYIKTINNIDLIKAKNESGTIHGEPFNGDTLFDNNDKRDFNPTEWLDLELTTESYEIYSAILETKRAIAVNEAIIMSDGGIDTFRRLQVMREAELQKFKDSLMEIIKRIGEAIEKFIANLKDKLGLNTKFIKDNSDAINQPFKFEKVASYGDILAGLYRIKKEIMIDAFNYDLMKNRLENSDDFFRDIGKKHLNESSQHRKIDWNDTKLTPIDICKAYFGASMSEDKYPKCEYTAAEVERARRDIIAYLQDQQFISSIRKEKDKLETEIKKETNNIISNAAPENQEPQTASAHESMYYSELYQRWFTEAEIQMGTDGSDGTNADNKSKESNKAFKTYLGVRKSIILSKITAAEFIRNEWMSVMEKHAQSYGKKAKEGTETNEGQQPNQK